VGRLGERRAARSGPPSLWSGRGEGCLHPRHRGDEKEGGPKYLFSRTPTSPAQSWASVSVESTELEILGIGH
jgi:hypothetical protein